MKVLQINTVCGILSTGRICADLAEVLESQGYECKIAYGRMSVPEKYQKYAIKIGNRFTIKLDAALTRLFDNAGFNSYFSTKKFIKKIRDYNPDVIHLHNLHGYYINIKVLFEFLKAYGKPVVWTLHDCWAFTGHCTHFSVAGCDKWKTQCFNCPQKKVYPRSKFLSRAKINFKNKKRIFCGVRNLTIITPSKWLAKLVSQSYLSGYPTMVINNGIDLSVFKPTAGDFRSKYDIRDKKIILGVASAWGKMKGLADFVKLSYKLDDTYKIVVVGLNESQRDSLPSNILGITRTNSTQELAEIYSTADVFLNLTYQDNYPTVNLEAQACGTPVITYETGGSVESVPVAIWI